MGRKPLLNRDALIETSLDCFLRSGFEETTFQEIATALGVSQPAIYRFYKNKMHLLADSSAWAADKGRAYIDGAINQRDSAMERFKQYLKANLDFFYDRPREAFAITAVYFFAQTNEVMRDYFNQLQKTSMERFEIGLTQIAHEKQKVLKDPRDVAELIQSLLIGELFKNLHAPNKKKRALRAAFIMKQAQVMVDAAFGE